MKPVEVHEMTNEELERALTESRRELFSLRMNNQIGQVENTDSIRQTRRDIARLLTERREREMRSQLR